MIADTVAAVLIVVSTAYAVLAGADFGGGVWDLLAGSARGGAAVRQRIDRSIAPVWESNHVWLVIALVLLWTGFPVVFADIFTTLFVPLSVAALGIVLRGAGYAFRGEVRTLRWQTVYGGMFAVASLLTPFFLGTVVGSVVTGQVRGASGDPVGSWVNPTSLLTGALFVVVGAYLAAVYLAVDCDRAGESELRRYFTRRALAAGLVSGVLAGVTMAVLRTSAPEVFTELTRGRGLPLVVISVLAGVMVLVLLVIDRTRLVRPFAGLAVAAVIWGWAVAQYPYLLPPRLTIAAAAAPDATEVTELVVVGIIVVLVIPSFVLLFRLATERAARADAGGRGGVARGAGGARGGGGRGAAACGVAAGGGDGAGGRPGAPAPARPFGSAQPLIFRYVRAFVTCGRSLRAGVRYVRAFRRSRCGTTTYLGSSVEAMPAWNVPKRCRALPASRATPAAAAATRLRRATVTAAAAPPRVSNSAAWCRRCARPVVHACLTTPGRRTISRDATSSAAAPAAANRRAGPASATGAKSMPTAPPLAAAEPVYTNGSSRRASCQAGAAVCASRAAV